MIKTDYDAIADAYSLNRRVSEHVIAELQSFCSITPASRVLEVGCGTAKHIHALVDAMNQVGYVNLTAREIKKTLLTADVAPYQERAFSCLQLIDDLQEA